jgi:riboflavin kinase/FMN adenylyltransferase
VNNNADCRSIEVNIFDFDSDIYEAHIRVEFYKKLRDEQKFASIEQLKSQLYLDRTAALAFFNTRTS